MITHEEALQYVYLIEEDITNVGKELKKYIAQQQAKEERAKKVEELWQLEHKARLTLVECMNNPKDEQLKSDYFAYLMRIEQLDEELEEELK